MLKYILTLLAASLLVPSAQADNKRYHYHELSPSRVVADTLLGDFRRVNYDTKTVRYKKYDYPHSVRIGDHYFLFGPTSVVVLDGEGRQKYFWIDHRIDNWGCHPTFYFPRKGMFPFLISVSEGMEEYDGSTIYVVDKGFCMTLSGTVPLVPYAADNECFEEAIESVMIPRRRAGTIARLTFDCDSLFVPYVFKPISAEGIWFNVGRDGLNNSPAYENIGGVRERRFYEKYQDMAAMAESYVLFDDFNGDGHTDVVVQRYVTGNSTAEDYKLTFYFCRDYRQYDTLNIVPDSRLLLNLNSPRNGVMFFNEMGETGFGIIRRSVPCKLIDGKLVEQAE